MSRLLARIMLAILMLPLGAAVYTFTVVMLYQLWGLNDTAVFMSGNAVTAVFLAVYWTGLWRRSVRWDRVRIRATIVAIGLALVAGLVIGLAGLIVDDSFGCFIGGIVFMLTGLAFVTLAWRERPGERALRTTSGRHAGVACPTCGYNMTGLRESACPECGAQFTLDELMSQQADHEQGELSVAE